MPRCPDEVVDRLVVDEHVEGPHDYACKRSSKDLGWRIASSWGPRVDDPVELEGWDGLAETLSHPVELLEETAEATLGMQVEQEESLQGRTSPLVRLTVEEKLVLVDEADERLEEKQLQEEMLEGILHLPEMVLVDDGILEASWVVAECGVLGVDQVVEGIQESHLRCRLQKNELA